MIKEFTGGAFARSTHERYHRTRWTEDIQVTSFDCDDADQAEKTEREPNRPGSDVKVDVPAPTNAKSIFLEAARLRNRDTHRRGGSVPERDSKLAAKAPPRSAAAAVEVKLADLLAELSRLLESNDLTEAQTAVAAGGMNLGDLLAKLSRLLESNDLTEVQTFLETQKRQVPPVARPAVPTVLETFDGVLDCIDGETAYVTLTSVANGDVLYGEYPAATFSAKGIEEEDRFICKTVETDGATRIEIEAVPDAELTEEHIKAIREKIEKVLPRHDPGVRY